MTAQDVLSKITVEAKRYERAAARAQEMKAHRDAMILTGVGCATYDTVAKAAGITKDRVNQIVREQRRRAGDGGA